MVGRSDCVVLFLTEGARWLSDDPDRLAAFRALAKRGGGLACLHWGMSTHRAGTGLRLKTTTSLPLSARWRARTVPTWPEPPGMTTFTGRASGPIAGTQRTGRLTAAGPAG